MQKEKSFENQVKQYLKSIGVYPLGTPLSKMSVKSIGYYEKRWGGSQFIKSGLPDLHITIGGKSLEVELKAENGKPSELQMLMINQINNSGGISLILYPKDFEDFKKLVQKLKGEKRYDD